MIERVLIPVDGSDLSDGILPHVSRVLPKSSTPEIKLIRVVPQGALGLSATSPDSFVAARSRLARTTRLIATEDVEVSSEVLVGNDPSRTILEFARAFRPSLVALSSHGRTGLARCVVGSVAERVLRDSESPVLLANGSVPRPRMGDVLRRILVPLALAATDMADEVPPLVHGLARAHSAEVVLFHVLAPTVPTFRKQGSRPITSRTDALRMLGDVAGRFDGIETRCHAAYGFVTTELLGAIKSEKVDLVMMTTHARVGPARWIFGSVAEDIVRHAPCPVLVARYGITAEGCARTTSAAEREDTTT